MNNDKPYYIVKVTDLKWADKLLDGQIFMRPLSDFGDFFNRPENCDNDYRGDNFEGLSHSFESGKEHKFLKDALGDNSNLEGSGFISESLRQEKIVYSLFCLEYSEDDNEFISPNNRLLDFGDTAIIIIDPKEFLYRICQKLLELYNENFWIGAKRIKYDVDLTTQNEYDEFSKSKSYSWQNEYRIAVDLSEGKIDKVTWDSMTDFARIMFLNQGGKVDTDLDRKPLLLEIGDIRDICVKINTQDLIELKLPFDQFFYPPVRLVELDPPRKPRLSVFRPIIKPKK